MIRRFFFTRDQIDKERILLTGPEAHHITSVLRMQAGSPVELYDGTGTVVQGKILLLNGPEVVITVLASRVEAPPSPALTLVQAMLKGKKMDLLIQKATELGVHTFTPLVSRYCEKRTHSSQVHERWQRIMQEACKQCGRPVLMRITAPLPLERLEVTENSSLILPWEGEEARPLSPELVHDRPTILLIGPEGGFHPDEIARARELGFTTVTLGPRILRAETAALAAVSIVQYLTSSPEPLQKA